VWQTRGEKQTSERKTTKGWGRTLKRKESPWPLPLGLATPVGETASLGKINKERRKLQPEHQEEGSNG